MKKYLALRIFQILIACSFCFSQQRVLLHIKPNGQQEAIPILPDESIAKVIEQVEIRNLVKPNMPSDTLRYFSMGGSDLGSNFGFLSKDVAFQWYVSQADGVIKEFWWRNYTLQGDSKKATIRAWRGNYRLLDLPINGVNTKGRMGYYLDTGPANMPTPFKPSSNAKYYYVANSDTTNMVYDPLDREAEWLPNGKQVSLDSNIWQGINLTDWGNPFYVKKGEIIGFTLSNDSYFNTGNTRMEILSKELPSTDSTLNYSPFHSIKFYTQKSSDSITIGWQIRSYDWGMYAVVDYSTDGPLLTYQFLNLEQQVNDAPKKISVVVKNYGGPAQPTKIKDVFLKSKIDYAPYFETVKMVASADTFKAIVSGLPSGKTMKYYVAVFDSSGRRFQSQIQSYSNVTKVDVETELPNSFTLFQNYPNPFNPSTTISFSLASKSFASLKIFDVLGREVITLVNEQREAGTYSADWNASQFSSGIYFAIMRAGSFTSTKKLLLMK